MKKPLLIALLSLVSLFTVLSSCNKYEEGSNFSLLTKKKRLSRMWTLQDRTVNGIETLDYFDRFGLEIVEDGPCLHWKRDAFLHLIVKYGTWEFSSDKSMLTIEGNWPHGTGTFEIVKLTKRELKLREFVDGDAVYWVYRSYD